MHLRGLSWTTVGALVLAELAGAAIGGEPPIVRAAEFRMQVAAVREETLARLRKLLEENDEAPELAYLAFRAAGVSSDDPVAFNCRRRMQARLFPPALGVGHESSAKPSPSDVAAGCLALTVGLPKAPAEAAFGGDSLLAPPETFDWLAKAAKALESALSESPRGESIGRALYEDSLLLSGLDAAARAGVPVPATTWTDALKRYLESQETKPESLPRARHERGGRGWREDPSARVAAAWTTTAAIGAVSVCRGAMLRTSTYNRALDVRAAKSVNDGIAWFVDAADLFDLPFMGRSLGALTLVETTADRVGVEHLGAHDWFAEGVAGLRFGSSRAPWSDVPTACRALLFLVRPTSPALSRPFDGSAVDFVAAQALSDADFEELMSRVLARVDDFDNAADRERFLAKATALGPRIVLPIVKRLTSVDAEQRTRAFALLKRATGFDLGFSPTLVGSAREAAVERWQAWWLANERTLHYDATKGLILP